MSRSQAWPRFQIRRLLSDRGGYTLVEMVILVGMMAVLSGLVVANTKVGDNRQQVRDAAAQFVTTARQAESMAGASEKVNSPDGRNESRKAYGVCFSSRPDALCNNLGGPLSHFQLYARDGSGLTDKDPQDPTGQAFLVKNYALPKKVIFQGSAEYWIDYTPPQPTMSVYKNGSKLTITDSIKAQSDDGSYVSTIDVRPAAGNLYVN